MMKAEETAKRIVGAFSQDRKRSSADPWLTVSPIGTDAIEELIAEAIRQAEAAARAERSSGCACKIGDDGETILEWCLVHSLAQNAARAEEREACAEIADFAVSSAKASTFTHMSSDADINMAETLAKAIRARND